MITVYMFRAIVCKFLKKYEKNARTEGERERGTERERMIKEKSQREKERVGGWKKERKKGKKRGIEKICTEIRKKKTFKIQY